MRSSLSLDLRSRIASALMAGETVWSVAVRFGVCAATAVRLGQKARAGEDLKARARGTTEMIIRGDVADWVRSRLAEKPDLAVRALAAELCGRGTTVTHDTVWRFIRREGLTFKKTLVASEQDRPKVARFRDRWKAHQHRISADRLVFLDETWIKTNMTRLRGWFMRGTALVAKVPHGHWKTLTFIGALRQDEIVAPCVFDGPINANTFVAWVEQSLVPVLKPGDVVVLDNLGSHKDPRAQRAIRAAGAHLLFLPPYSPDLNPIEMIFAKLKTLFRKADSRTVEEAWRKIGTLLDMFSPEECAAYIRHAGYGSKSV